MSHEHSLFFQQTETGELPVSNSPTVRTRVSAECPGRLDNIVTVISGKDAIGGIGRPKNVGNCPLHIAWYDQNGTFLGAIKLEPGETLEGFKFPEKTLDQSNSAATKTAAAQPFSNTTRPIFHKSRQSIETILQTAQRKTCAFAGIFV